MTYRSLLVHLGVDPLCTARTRVAIRLAKELDCHLVGVAPTGLIDLPVTAGAAASMGELAALAWDTLRGQADQATQQFRTACQAAGLTSFEAVLAESEAAPSLVRHAHCSDLVIVSQADPDSPGHSAAQHLVEQVVLAGARPALILPCVSGVSTALDRALVAWDDSREAARAVSDALPLLRRAKNVQVVSWIERGQHDDDSLRVRLDALHRWLMWQGVTAEVSVESTDIAIAEAMLSRAADQGADLIVMGAYGHARWAELVLGGATRGLLQSMTAPVLMSH
ncbi:universal stress protein [Piscinibacter sp.]|uniref:universal stress protein n=1 Tax=Piscinibacter sp. TaxID=1903157 RepID=UPI002BCAB544|nr:universal stress protein [Albitalea sp.]HUG25255.1 universal stress protein [Albitalea sp.]